MADLSSNSTSLRLIMTTRAKLAEVSTALTAAAAATAGSGRADSSSGASPSAAVTGLPLQPWAWPWSAQCGCRGKGGGSSSSSSCGSGDGSAGQQVLSVQHPPLQSVLQEMANTAASIHRRVMIYLRAQEAAVMQV